MFEPFSNFTAWVGPIAAKVAMSKVIEVVAKQTGEMISDSKNVGIFPGIGLQTWGNKQYTRSTYLNAWKNYVLSKSNSDEITSCKWVYATDVAVSCHEQFLFTHIPALYQTGNTTECTEKSSQHIAESGHTIFFLYGHGNMLREASIIDASKKYRGEGQLGNVSKHMKVFAFDCSPSYHERTLSRFNPFIGIIKKKNMASLLIDFEDPKGQDIIRKIRDQYPNNKVCHLFLGNFAGNIPEKSFRNMVKELSYPGDLVVVEHKRYEPDFFENLNEDYTCTLMKKAIARLFLLEEREIVTSLKSDFIVESDGQKRPYKYVLGEFSYQNQQYLIKSLLRRNFHTQEIHQTDFDADGNEFDEINRTNIAFFKRTGG